jgi:hypothetical protein
VARASDELAAGLTLFVVPEVPLNQQVLTFGVAIHTLAITTELRIVGREEAKSCVNAVDERLNLLFVTKDHPALPVGRHGAEVDDLDVTYRVNDLGGLCGGDLAHDAPSALLAVLESHSTGSISGAPLVRGLEAA